MSPRHSVAEWMQRPRRRVIDAVPSRLVGALWTFPMVCLGVAIGWLRGGARPESPVSILIFFIRKEAR